MERIQEARFTWFSIKHDIGVLDAACECKLAKAGRRWPFGPAGHIPPELPFSKIYVDWVGPFRPSFCRSGQTSYVLHVIDNRWGYSRLFVTREKTAEKAASKIVKTSLSKAPSIRRKSNRTMTPPSAGAYCFLPSSASNLESSLPQPPLTTLSSTQSLRARIGSSRLC